MKLVENIAAFTENSSIHGINYIARSTLSKTVRCAWVFIFVFSLFYAATMISFEAKGNKISQFVLT